MDNKMSFSRFINMNVELRNDYMSNLKKISRLGTEIFSYCLMPNHYHILLKQLEDDQIRSFISKIQNAFAKYINLKDKRAGPLFQSRFKARWIENEEIFLHTSRYIHLNPSTSFLVKPDELEFYEWSSYPSYLSKDNNEMLEKNLILNISGGVEKYRDFVMNNLDYQRKLYKIKHLLLE
jgi:putative transposase